MVSDSDRGLAVAQRFAETRAYELRGDQCYRIISALEHAGALRANEERVLLEAMTEVKKADLTDMDIRFSRCNLEAIADIIELLNVRVLDEDYEEPAFLTMFDRDLEHLRRYDP